MAEPKTNKSQTSTTSSDNDGEKVGQRGEATQLGGNKIHGDDLEGIIPHTPMKNREDGEKRRK